MTTQKESNKLLRFAEEEGLKWREKKIKEVLNKENPSREELAFLDSWSKMFKNYKLKELINFKVKNG